MLAPRSTAWRWEAATSASEHSDSQALYLLESADTVTRRAYLFKRAVDSGLDGSRWSDVEAAHELWANRPGDKLFVEGLLLGGAEVDKIAYQAGADVADIRAYHDLFFDVSNHLDKPGWLVARLFQGGLYAPVSSRDRVGIMHRLAWLSGPEIFSAFYTGRYDAEIKGVLHTRLHDMLAKQSMLAAMCLGGRGELDIELLRIFVADSQKTVAEVASGGDAKTAQAIHTFLTSIPMSVNDPKAVENLNLPAREPRAAEYLNQIK